MANDVKTRRTLLASAARTATTVTAQQKDASQQFIRLYLSVTAASGTGGLKVIVRGYDPVTGLPAIMNTGGAGVTATGLSVFELMPNGTATGLPTGILETVGRILPCVWDVQVLAGDATSYTYSLGCEVFPVG
jgi:hypothetical protein